MYITKITSKVSNGGIKLLFNLFNKDNLIATFRIETTEYGVNCIMLNVVNKSLLPMNLRDLRTWIESRYILTHRNNIKAFYSILGITKLEEFVDITHCVSLKDTFWVQRNGGKLRWENISPYTNPLNRVVADYSFDRKINGKNITGSPDFSTDGNFPKCWKRVNGVLRLYKAGSSGASNAGNEPYSEVYATKVAKLLGVYHVPYEIDTYKDKLVSKCDCMCNEDVGFISYRDCTDSYEADFEKLLRDFNYSREILDMLLLDFLTCNVDRHYGNFGFQVDNNLNKVIGLAPIFDNNLSCIPYYTTDETLEYYINDIRAKDGRTWYELFDLIDCDYVRHKLNMFKTRYTYIKVTPKRDKIVNNMLKYQLSSVL